VLGLLVLAATACTDPDAKLREEFQVAALALAEQRLPGAKISVVGRDGWLLHKGELRHLNAGSYIGENALRANPQAPPEYADPVPAIVDFNNQLKERGIDLFLMPVPVRPAIYPESVLGSEAFAERKAIPNLYHPLQELLHAVEEQGVRVVDLTTVYLQDRERPQRGPVFCRSDTHWTPYGITLGAQILTAEIKQMPWYESVPKKKFRQRWTTMPHKGVTYEDYEKATGETLEPEQLQMRSIKRSNKKGKKKLKLHWPEGPVILMGDSNATKWSPQQSGLPHILAFELGFPVDVLAVPGGGANETRLNLFRKLRDEPDYLDEKRVVIWCFTARFFTNTADGWIYIPL
jgi:alginate O-acetyltransferase complex protein AlgJ